MAEKKAGELETAYGPTGHTVIRTDVTKALKELDGMAEAESASGDHTKAEPIEKTGD